MKTLLSLMIALVFLAACASHVIIQEPTETEHLRSRIGNLREAAQTTREAIARSRGAPHRTELWMQLAELLREEAAAHERLYTARRQQVRPNPSAEIRALRRQIIEIYVRVETEGSADEVVAQALFGMAREQHELGELGDNGGETGMVPSLNRIIDNDRFTDVIYRHAALIALGDHSLGRRRYEDAERYYDRVEIDETSPLQSVLRYKLATIASARGDCKVALPHYEKAIDSSVSGRAQNVHRQRLIIGDDVDISRLALVDSVHCYSLERPAATIVPYLRERALDRDSYVDALENAQNRFASLDEHAAVADIVRELLQQDPEGEGRLDDARMLHETVTTSRLFDHAGADSHLIVDAYRRARDESGRSRWERRILEGEFEVRARDMAGKTHFSAISSQSREDAFEAVEAYEVYLAFFPSSRYVPMMTAKLAEVLGLGGRWLDSGRQYQKLASLEANSAGRGDALCHATKAYQKSLESRPPLKLAERVEARAAFRKSGNGCLADGNLPPSKSAAIKFAIAESYYTEDQRTKANDLMNAIVYEFPGTPTAQHAALKVLTVFYENNEYEDLVMTGRRYLSPSCSLPEKTKTTIRALMTEGYVGLNIEVPRALDPDYVRPPIPDNCPGYIAEADRQTKTPMGEKLLVRAFKRCMEAGDTKSLQWVSRQVLRNHPESVELGKILYNASRSIDARFELALAYTLSQNTTRRTDSRVNLLLFFAKLREELADDEGAERAYREALKRIEHARTQQDVAIKLADLLIARDRLDDASAILQPYTTGNIVSVGIESRLGTIERYHQHYDAAQAHLLNALDGEYSARRDDAMTWYGLAELGLTKLAQMTPSTNVDEFQELLDFVDRIELDYLNAVKCGQSQYSFASFARVAAMYEMSAPLMDKTRLVDLSGDEAEQVDEAIKARAKQLYSQRDAALAACSELALQIRRFDRGARSCLAGAPPPHDPLRTKGLLRHNPRAQLKGVGLLQARVVLNPYDIDALTQLSERYLEAEDFLMARLLLRIVLFEQGDIETTNRLGLAAARSGDVETALEAFSSATADGHDAAPHNMAAVARQVGLPWLAKRISDKATSRPERRKLLPAALLLLDE